MDLSVTYIFSEAFRRARTYALRVILIMILNSGLSYAIMRYALPEAFWDAYAKLSAGDMQALERLLHMQINPLGPLAAAVVSIFLAACLDRALVAIAREHQASFVDAFKLPLLTFLKYFAAYLLLVVIIAAGSMLFVVPGVYLAIRLVWVPLYLVEHNDAGIFEAFGWSWKATSGRAIDLFGLAIAAMGLSIGGVLIQMIFNLVSSLLGPFAVVASLVGSAIALYIASVVNIAKATTYADLAP